MNEHDGWSSDTEFLIYLIVAMIVAMVAISTTYTIITGQGPDDIAPQVTPTQEAR